MHQLTTTADGERLDRFAAALRAGGFAGDIDRDSALRAAMSTDNSVYQIEPDIIVAPQDDRDLVRLLNVAEEDDFRSIAITARGGGTGTNGQSLNAGIVVDLRRHMNRLIAFDAEEGWADVEPGMVLDDLNEKVRPSGWFFAPETSTSTRCTIGGMVSTDASGKGSRIYGKTSDNIDGLDIARPQGILSSLKTPPDWAHVMLDQARTAAEAGRQAFIENTPRLTRRFTGYDLERACNHDGTFEWWRLFLGAEGTLGIVSRIRVRLRRLEPEKRLVVAGFATMRDALAAAGPLIEADPTAVEVMDETVQAMAGRAGILAKLPDALMPRQGQGIAYVFIEFNGDDAVVLDRRVAHARSTLAALPGAGAVHVASGPDEVRSLWAVRSASVGLLGKVDGNARPIAFVEDTVVPPENLPAFLDDFLAVLSGHGLTFAIYGHVDVGCLHIRPALDVDAQKDRARLLAVSDKVYALTRKHGGIFWGEHGKGVRGTYLRDWIGAQAYGALQGVKAAFDPTDRYNPGKLVSNGPDIMGIDTPPFRRFNAPAGDPLALAFRCNGNAQCLSYMAATPMCPSFKASWDVRHSPKGRADALRGWHTARQAGANDLHEREQALMNVLDTCLGCKACASSCPVQVDIPTMRTAFYADYFKRHRRPFSDRLVLMAERMSPMIQRFTPLLRPFWPMATRLAAPLAGMTELDFSLARHPGREFRLYESELGRPLPSGTVILVQDWFTALFDERMQRDAIAGLLALGYGPRLLPMLPAGKAAHNAGDLGNFDKMARKLSRRLARAARSGAPLLTFEPAFGMMLRQEYRKAGIKLPEIQMVQEFLAGEVGKRSFPKVSDSAVGTIRLLSHCTERTASPASPAQWREVFGAIGIELETPETGCCGMAGLFGHQRRHQDVSRNLFAASWQEQMNADQVITATGFSCRSQVARLTPHKLRHPLGLVAQFVNVERAG